jgi:redox-sensitive bicupin YhaK (pirin superfamily)
LAPRTGPADALVTMERRTFLTGTAAALGTFAAGQQGAATQGTTMRITVRPSAQRGHADHGWLDARHSFSFADYHDPAHMGFRTLRVINQDRVQPGRGFPTHPHRDMEIFTYVLEGALEHKDSMGNGRVLRPGDIQLMSAGTGVTHSEFNPSRSEGLHLLQIWIHPAQRGLRPSYTEWHPGPTAAAAKDVVIISPDGRDESAVIHQDAIVRRLRLAAGDRTDHVVRPGRGMWLQIVSGSLLAGGTALAAGDGASTEDAGTLPLVAQDRVEALLFDLA